MEYEEMPLEDCFPERKQRRRKMKKCAITAIVTVLLTGGFFSVSPKIISWWSSPKEYSIFFDCPNCMMDDSRCYFVVGQPRKNRLLCKYCNVPCYIKEETGECRESRYIDQWVICRSSLSIGEEK